MTKWKQLAEKRRQKALIRLNSILQLVNLKNYDNEDTAETIISLRNVLDNIEAAYFLRVGRTTSPFICVSELSIEKKEELSGTSTNSN